MKCWQEWVNMWIIFVGDTSHWLWYFALMANCSDISLKLIGIQLTTLADKVVETFQEESTMAWAGVKRHYQKALNYGLYGVAFKLCGASLSSSLLIRIQVKRLVPPSEISFKIWIADCFVGQYPTSCWGAETESLLSCHFMARGIMPPNVAGALPCKIGRHWSDM